MLELPSSINGSKVTARMDNGMLTITAPKSSGSGRSTAASA
jgi:HSP20 family molecular chaperone IbpA